MLRRSQICFPMRNKNYDEIKYTGRRLKLFPTIDRTQARQAIFLDRFKETGPEYSRVWLSLGTKFRRRKVGRDRDWLDKRYYWRPIPRGIQRLYQKELRKNAGHQNKYCAPMTLFPKNHEIGAMSMNPKYEGQIDKMYGGEWAADVPFDWEYRVY